MITHKDIIAALGGPHKLHALLALRGVSVAKVTARSWALPGRTIPAKYWADVKAIADANAVPVSIDDLAAGAATQCPRAAA